MPVKNKTTEMALGLPIIYPEIEVRKHVGKDAITVQMAKELLGWQEETSEEKFGTDYLLIDENGHKIRCLRNTRNREFTESWSRSIAQDILQKDWRLNLENIIIGRNGGVVSGQHRLIGLILASQILQGEQKAFWGKKWDTEPTIESLVAFGACEEEDTIRTIDNTKPRSLKDVLFAVGQFGKSKKSDRRKLCTILDAAIRVLWMRTGRDRDKYLPYRTKSQAIDFVLRHPHVAKAVRHIFEENTQKQISRYIAAGRASALLFLMGASDTDGETYWSAKVKSEAKIKWTNWEKACEFWTMFGNGTGEFKAIRNVIGTMGNEKAGGGSPAERAAVMCKAWQLFITDRPITEAALKLEYQTDEDGIRSLAPTVLRNVGGIDRGDYRADDEDAEEEATAVPSPEELAAEKEARRKDREERARSKEQAKKERKARKKKPAAEDDWVPPKTIRTRRKKVEVTEETPAGDLISSSQEEGSQADEELDGSPTSDYDTADAGMEMATSE